MKFEKIHKTPDAAMLLEETLNITPRYRGRLFSAESLIVRLPDESLANREIIRHPGGAAVVAITADDCILLVSQYRVAVNRVLTEIPAGKLEPGEDPLLCAKRELSEETGYAAASWRSLGMFYPSPGYLDEALYLFLATELTAGEPHPDAGEHLSVTKRPFADVMRAIDEHALPDAKTIIAVLLADRYRKGEHTRA